MAQKSSDTSKELSRSKVDAQEVVVEASNVTFLYNGRFALLALLCSIPLLYFGGERLFGVGAMCLLTVYIVHVSFHDTKSSLIVFVISVAIMQFVILYSIAPLLWQSLFNFIFLVVCNVFIVLTGGLGVLQFQVFVKDEIEFSRRIEYFLFLLYPPCCAIILVWLISWTLASYLAPYLLIIIGFPMCHTFLDQKLKPSFGKNDEVLGQAEKMLALFNFIFSPSFVYFLLNFFYLLHFSSWVSLVFCVSLPCFLVTFLDTTDLRDIADINNSYWRAFQVFTGCLSLMLGAILAFIHGLVDEVNAVFLAMILLCSITFFVSVKYRYSRIISTVACGLLLILYIAWFTALPWNLIFSMGTSIRLSVSTVNVLIVALGLLSVLALAVSVTRRYRTSLNAVLILHTVGFVTLEVVMLESKVYSPYLMMLSSLVVLYLVQRLYQVARLTKVSTGVCISLHGTKLLFVFTASMIAPSSSTLEGSSTAFGAWSSLPLFCGGFCLCWSLANILLFEHGNKLDRFQILRYIAITLGSLVLLSSTFLRALCVLLVHDQASMADLIGLILLLGSVCFLKLAFLHSSDQGFRKQSVLVFFIAVLIVILQPYFNLLQIVQHLPKLIFRELFYDTWQVVFAEYVFLPWGTMMSLAVILALLLKLLSVGEMFPLSVHVISHVIGTPLGLYMAHLLLPYPKLPSSILAIPYMLSTSMTTSSLLLAVKDQFNNTSPKIYVIILVLSVASVAAEVTQGINVNILQSDIPPAVLYQACLHLVTIVQLQPQLGLQTALDKRNSMFPSVARNISVLLVFLSGLMFAPQDYYDLLMVPVCGLLLMPRIKSFGFLTNESKEDSLRRVLFTLVLGTILYYRIFQQLPIGKWNFWSTFAFLVEICVIIGSLLVYLIVLSVFWKECVKENEGLALAVVAPVFTLMLFYGRTTAGQVLGIVGPALAYSAFYYPCR